MPDFFKGDDHRWMHIQCDSLITEGANLNGLVFDREFMRQAADSMTLMPVNIHLKEDGKPAGHTMAHPVGCVLDTQFIEDEKGAKISATLGIWRHRFGHLADQLKDMFDKGELKWSMELAPFEELVNRIDQTVKPLKGKFTGVALVGSPAEGAVRTTRLAELSAAYYNDLEKTKQEVPLMDLTEMLSAVRNLFREELSEHEAEKIISDELLGAKWTREFINDLPDAAFAYVEKGKKDESGKTVPRSLRHFPHHDSSVKNGDEKDSLDMPHLRNAMARLSQSPTGEHAKQHLLMHEKQVGMGMKTAEEIKELQNNMDELNRLQVANEELGQKLSHVETERDQATNKITELTASVSEKDEKTIQLNKELGELTASLEEANKKANSLEGELSEFKTKVAKEAKAQERMAEIETIKAYDPAEKKEKLALFTEMKEEEFNALRDERAKGIQMGTFNNGDTEETEKLAEKKRTDSLIESGLEAIGALDKKK